MINKHCDLIYCNSPKQSKANAKLYPLTNNYFKFLFQFQKYFLNLFKNDFAILNNNAKKIDNKVDCHAYARNDDLNKLCNDRKKFVITSGSEVIHIQNSLTFLTTRRFQPLVCFFLNC